MFIIGGIINLCRILPKMEPMDDTSVNTISEIYKFRPYEIIKLEFRAKNRNFSEHPKARSGHRIVCTESNLYCFGGFNPDLVSRSRRNNTAYLFQELWKFNFITKKWQLFFRPGTSGMPEELASNAMIMAGEMLILFGGTGFPFGEACSNKCHIFCTNPERPSITQLEVEGDLPTPLYGPAIILHDHYLYTIGGTTGYDYSCDIYRLDLLTKRWECVYICRPELQDDPDGRYRHEIVQSGHMIYILGGGTAQTVFDLENIPAFNLIAHKWTYVKTKPDPSIKDASGYPKPRRCHSCVQYDTEFGIEAVIAGGCAENRHFSDIWKLCFPTLEWKLIKTAKLPNPIYFHDAGTPGNGCMYIFGGIEVQAQLTRTSDLYKMWVTIPKLSEICWDAISYYNPNLVEYSKVDLLRFGIPQKFISRVPDT